jgi:hypothetical protein
VTTFSGFPPVLLEEIFSGDTKSTLSFAGGAGGDYALGWLVDPLESERP